MDQIPPAPSSNASADSSPGTHARASRRRRWLRRLLVVVVLLAVAMELGLRLVLGLGNPVLYRLDPACGYLPAPDQNVRRYFCSNRINSYGMRCEAIREPKPAGEFRVLFVGDSVTYGTTSLDQGRIFTSLIGDELGARLSRPVEVLNASAGGWAVSNELGYIKSRGIFSADLVVFVLNTGDLTQAFS